MSKMRDVLDFLSNCETGMGRMSGMSMEVRRFAYQAGKSFQKARLMLEDALKLPEMVPPDPDPKPERKPTPPKRRRPRV